MKMNYTKNMRKKWKKYQMNMMKKWKDSEAKANLGTIEIKKKSK